MATKVQIKAVMIVHVEECRDKLTGEVNHTQLAELAAEDLDVYIDHMDYGIPQEFFEIALDFN
jgi:hypothetical protein